MPGHSDWAPRRRDRAVYSWRHHSHRANPLHNRTLLAEQSSPSLLSPAPSTPRSSADHGSRRSDPQAQVRVGGRRRRQLHRGGREEARGGNRRRLLHGGGHQEARGGLDRVDRGAPNERKQCPRALLLLVVPHGAAAGSPNPSGGSCSQPRRVADALAFDSLCGVHADAMEQPRVVAGPRRIDPVQEYPQPRRQAQVDAFDPLQLRRLCGADANTLEQPRVIAGVRFNPVEPCRITGVHEDTMEQPRFARRRLVDLQPRRVVGVRPLDSADPLRRLASLQGTGGLQQPRVIAGVHFDTVEPRRIPGVHEDTMEQPRVARPCLVDPQPRRVVGVRPLDPADPLRRLAGLQATGALQQPRVAGVCPLDPADPLRLAGPHTAGSL
jgi:hypothetical protein